MFPLQQPSQRGLGRGEVMLANAVELRTPLGLVGGALSVGGNKMGSAPPAERAPEVQHRGGPTGQQGHGKLRRSVSTLSTVRKFAPSY